MVQLRRHRMRGWRNKAVAAHNPPRRNSRLPFWQNELLLFPQVKSVPCRGASALFGLLPTDITNMSPWPVYAGDPRPSPWLRPKTARDKENHDAPYLSGRFLPAARMVDRPGAAVEAGAAGAGAGSLAGHAGEP